MFESLNPAIVTLLLRRSTGIQALECHVFITRSITEGKSIVSRIHEVCDFYKSHLNQQGNLFQYKPYRDYSAMNNEKSIAVNNNQNNQKLVSNVRSKVTIETHPVELDKHKRSKSVTSMNQTRPSVFSKIKANFKENKFIKKKNNNEQNSNRFERNINRSSIKSAPDNRSYQNEARFPSELAMMAKNTPNHIKNENNLLVKSTTSIKSDSHLKKEKKISFPKRFLFSARSSIKSSGSSVASQSQSSMKSSKKSGKSAKYASTSSLADLDFRDPKSIFDRNLLIDNSYPSLPPSRSVSPAASIHRRQKFEAKSGSNNFTNDSNKYQKNAKSPQLTLKEISNKQNTSSYVSTSSARYQYRQADNISQIYSINSIIDSSDESDKLKSPETNPEILSNHLVWNPSKRAPECLDSMPSRTNSPLLISSEHRQMCEQLYTKIDSNKPKTQEHMPQTYNRNTNSPFYSTTPISEVLETSSFNKFKFKDSAYNTNSSNDDNENSLIDKRYPSAFSSVNNNNEQKSTNKNHINAFLYQNSNNPKPNQKQIIGGVKG